MEAPARIQRVGRVKKMEIIKESMKNGGYCLYKPIPMEKNEQNGPLGRFEVAQYNKAGQCVRRYLSSVWASEALPGKR